MVGNMVFIFMLFSFSSNGGSIRKQGIMIGCVMDRCTVNIIFHLLFTFQVWGWCYKNWRQLDLRITPS